MQWEISKGLEIDTKDINAMLRATKIPGLAIPDCVEISGYGKIWVTATATLNINKFELQGNKAKGTLEGQLGLTVSGGIKVEIKTLIFSDSLE